MNNKNNMPDKINSLMGRVLNQFGRFVGQVENKENLDINDVKALALVAAKMTDLSRLELDWIKESRELEAYTDEEIMELFEKGELPSQKKGEAVKKVAKKEIKYLE